MTKKRKKVLTAWMVSCWNLKWGYMSYPFKNKKDVICIDLDKEPRPVRVRITVEEI